MAFSNNKGGFTDINITPFVDVMLVLLIIFMVTTPMIQQGESIDLPKTDSSLVSEDEKYITLSLDGLKKIDIDGDKVDFENLENYISNSSKIQEKKELFFKADKDLPYGFVITVISKIRNSGIEKINLITEAKD